MRRSTVERGYGRAHQLARLGLAPMVAAGIVDCVRCGERIDPGEKWDLGHPDGESPGGPEHASRCNRRAGGRRAAMLTNMGRTGRRVSRPW